jgi:hypothetical protein
MKIPLHSTLFCTDFGGIKICLENDIPVADRVIQAYQAPFNTSMKM